MKFRTSTKYNRVRSKVDEWLTKFKLSSFYPQGKMMTLHETVSSRFACVYFQTEMPLFEQNQNQVR